METRDDFGVPAFKFLADGLGRETGAGRLVCSVEAAGVEVTRFV
jgi:hypothetical protein